MALMRAMMPATGGGAGATFSEPTSVTGFLRAGGGRFASDGNILRA
jgi:hypothetical protein